MKRLYREQTPIEKYRIGRRTIFVKREDMYGVPPAPPLGKLRGLRVLLEELNAKNVRLVGCWDTRVSRLGQGLAAACTQFPRMQAVLSYPLKKGEPEPASILLSRDLGASVFALRGNILGICYNQARKVVESNGGYMLPFGLECQQAVDAVAAEAHKTPREICEGTVVLSCGSGVTLAGLLRGLPAKPKKIVGLSSGRSLAKISACIKRYVGEVPANVVLESARIPYDRAATVECPFPAHPHYDLKAWAFLYTEITRLRGPVLFWNIGA